MRPVRRLLVPLAVVAAAALGLAACGESTRPAAVVDGRTISQQDVVDELEAIRTNTGYVEAIEGSGGTVLGEEDDAFDSAFVATQLGVRIQYTIVGNEVDRRQLEADSACRDAARSSLEERFTVPGQIDGADLLEAFPDDYRDYLVEREANFLLLQGDLVDQDCVVDDAVAAYYEENRESLEQACTSHILVDTAEAAAEVKALLDAGADFAQVVAERSQDTASAANGGEVGCVGRGDLVPEYEEAMFSQPVGAIGEPVQSQFGFHIIRVDSRGIPTLDEARPRIAQQIAQAAQASFGEWFRTAVSEADVTVDPRYGTWDPTVAEITRPSTDSSSTSTTAPDAAEE